MNSHKTRFQVSKHVTRIQRKIWTSCVNDCHLVSGWCIFFGHVLISWKSKKQPRISKSSTEFEYQTMPSICYEIVWLCGLLGELGFPEHETTTLQYCKLVICIR